MPPKRPTTPPEETPLNAQIIAATSQPPNNDPTHAGLTGESLFDPTNIDRAAEPANTDSRNRESMASTIAREEKRPQASASSSRSHNPSCPIHGSSSQHAQASSYRSAQASSSPRTGPLSPGYIRENGHPMDWLSRPVPTRPRTEGEKQAHQVLGARIWGQEMRRYEDEDPAFHARVQDLFRQQRAGEISEQEWFDRMEAIRKEKVMEKARQEAREMGLLKDEERK